MNASASRPHQSGHGSIASNFFTTRSPRLWIALGWFALTVTLTAQVPVTPPAKVDFARDVMPLIQNNCIECHGPKKQKGGLRLDRRSSALNPFERRVIPGSSANSKVYQRMAGEDFGPQMPPKGGLRPEEIETVRAWIDQGGEWPEALSNEMELPPDDPKAVAMVEALREGDLSSFLKAARTEPKLLNARGPDGSTPFMYAALYANAATLETLLKLGADPNKRDDVNATALIWAARDFEKVRVLVRHGADVNVRSDSLRSPLMVAARRPGASNIVRYLLDHGANPNPNAKPTSESSPLMEALTSGDDAIVKLLIARGANAEATADLGLSLALTTDCKEGFDLLTQRITDKQVYTLALQASANLADAKSIRVLLDHGADVNAYDPTGRTALMYAAISDMIPVDVVKLLIERGADVNAKSKHAKSGDTGLSVLDIARLNGNTAVADLLVKSGANSAGVGSTTPAAPHPRSNNTLRKAIQDSLPLLQKADSYFTKNTGCASCHNDSLEAMAIALAREHGFRIDEKTATAQVQFNVELLKFKRGILHQGYLFAVGDMFGDNVLGYQLVGLQAEKYKPVLTTDTVAMEIQSRQKSNGEWPYPVADTRPPICLSHIGQTALAMRALQTYAPRTRRAEFAKSVRLAASWLAQAKAYSNEDRSWRLTGLVWAGADSSAVQKAMKELLATQRSDGGWSDLPTQGSTPYATAKSLVALQLAGLAASDPWYQRAVQYLLSTQQEDGSWYTKTRALGFQPYFDGSFPHGYDHWVSAAGTSWAAMALTRALPKEDPMAVPHRP